MSETELLILETFKKVIPKLDDKQKERLLGFGEGMAFKADQQEQSMKTA